ncbi:MAG: hypothetical protein GY756_26270 [bacterium]|nr:hypothetical protein [bacterium]
MNGSLPGSYAFVNNDTCFTGNSPGYKIQQCFNGITNESATFSMNCVDGNDPDSPGCSVGNSYYPVSSPGCNPGGDKFPDACATGSIN